MLTARSGSETAKALKAGRSRPAVDHALSVGAGPAGTLLLRPGGAVVLRRVALCAAYTPETGWRAGLPSARRPLPPLTVISAWGGALLPTSTPRPPGGPVGTQFSPLLPTGSGPGHSARRSRHERTPCAQWL